ncbi:hypothetical protein appser2_13220 [Actinobacillus pleuropneumoniae serovar 2 str. S1536]|nr:hypothetical protein appser2_13220 [Actinobacillus pleuropneumoniae serovar 2 str. S1536]
MLQAVKFVRFFANGSLTAEYAELHRKRWYKYSHNQSIALKKGVLGTPLL